MKRPSSFLQLALVVSVVVLLMAFSSQAQNTPNDYLTAHNAARALVAVGPMEWDADVEAYARDYANKRSGDCELVHSDGPYGENLFWGSVSDYTAMDAVKLWVDEKKYYHYRNNTCQKGQVCGHYTQVVWRDSVKLGCARVVCNSGDVLIICSYNPPGNYFGERPY